MILCEHVLISPFLPVLKCPSTVQDSTSCIVLINVPIAATLIRVIAEMMPTTKGAGGEVETAPHIRRKGSLRASALLVGYFCSVKIPAVHEASNSTTVEAAPDPEQQLPVLPFTQQAG